MNIFKKLSKLLELQIQIFKKKLENQNIENLWLKEIGRKFDELICNYPISEDDLLSMAETACKFTEATTITNIDKYLFEDGDFNKPKIIL